MIRCLRSQFTGRHIFCVNFVGYSIINRIHHKEMTRLEPIIAVNDVAKSSAWYQALLGLQSQHGGDHFEMLTDENETVILCLHLWGEHDHPTMTDPTLTVGNGPYSLFSGE